jgi:hypothetical protein
MLTSKEISNLKKGDRIRLKDGDPEMVAEVVSLPGEKSPYVRIVPLEIKGGRRQGWSIGCEQDTEIRYTGWFMDYPFEVI